MVYSSPVTILLASSPGHDDLPPRHLLVVILEKSSSATLLAGVRGRGVGECIDVVFLYKNMLTCIFLRSLYLIVS